ncbi:MAG TPA: YafY family protein [Candidatus Paceibacterota bacterium]|nr:YafY family protein [Candidatus Paceibacterota bacterium]
MNRIDRMLATILLLQSRRVIKAEDIAAHFEISLRTVYRDVAALGEAGVPIVAEAGVGYGLLKGYSIPPVMFTAEEASALFLGGELVEQLTDPSLQAQVRSALLKIRSVLPQNQRDHLDRLKQATALFIAPPKAKAESQAVLTQIQGALVQQRILTLDYRASGREEVTRREVEPLGLVYYSDHWHLIAFCRLRRDYRDFRTDRIIQLSVSGRAFQPHTGFSVRDYVESWCDKTQGVEVKVKFSLRAAERARRSWFAGLISEKRTKDGVVMTFPVGALEWITGWLLSFGTEVEVIAPGELRELLAEQAAMIAKHHSNRKLELTEISRVAESLLT